MRTFNAGDRVKKADINEQSIPAYAKMRGTVVAADRDAGGYALGALLGYTISVCWDCDGSGSVWVHPNSIKLAED